MSAIPVSLAAEGTLDEVVLRRLVLAFPRRFDPGVCYGHQGKNSLRQNISRFNTAAAHKPFIVLVDLDNEDCPRGLIDRWLPRGKHSNMLLRVAVREVESWLMADRERLAKFLAIPLKDLPSQPDTLADPKLHLINVARRSRKREIREDIPPLANSTSKVGKNYVGQLSVFASKFWQVDDTHTRRCSASLDRALTRLEQFFPRL